jgi:ATP-dependent Clp protease adaptor protein ClpS
MAKPKIKIEIKPDSAIAATTPWNVVVHNDPINYIGYVVVAFMNVLNLPSTEAKKLTQQVHQDGQAIVWSGNREKAEVLVLKLQQWHLNAQLAKND